MCMSNGVWAHVTLGLSGHSRLKIESGSQASRAKHAKHQLGHACASLCHDATLAFILSTRVSFFGARAWLTSMIDSWLETRSVAVWQAEEEPTCAFGLR